MTVRYIVGDAVTALRTLADRSVDLCFTSPPYPWKRDYLAADDPAKAFEIGQEATPAEAVATQLAWINEVHRVLAPHGVLYLVVDDTAAGSGGSGGDYLAGGLREGQPGAKGSALYRRKMHLQREVQRQTRAVLRDGLSKGRTANAAHFAARAAGRRRAPRSGWPLDKSLCGIPALLQVAMTYGVNPLTGEPCRQWAIRNVRAWCKPNPAVGAIVAKYRPAWEPILVASPDGVDPFLDVDALRVPAKHGEYLRRSTSHVRRGIPGRDDQVTNPVIDRGRRNCHPLGAPPLDWFVQPTRPFAGAHYAVFPAQLVVPAVAASPEQVCACGQPLYRLLVCHTCGSRGTWRQMRWCPCRREGRAPMWERTADLIRRCDCGPAAPRRPAVVLDPFAGTGTTLQVAVDRGRDAIGIDLDHRNAELAKARVGMLLQVEHLPVRPGNVG